MVFKTDHGLMQVNSIADCSRESILQYFQPLLSYHLSFRPLFCLFLSDILHRLYCIKEILTFLYTVGHITETSSCEKHPRFAPNI